MTSYADGYQGTPPAGSTTNTAPSTPSYTNADGSLNWAAIIGTGANLFNSNQQQDQQNQQAQDFTNQANSYGAILNPYGSQRADAQARLAALEKDPSSVANTPGYKFALQQGLGAVGNRDAKRFGVGAGSTDPDLMGFAQGLASTTYDKTIAQLSNEAGVGIGPQSAASIYQTGMLGNLASRAAANAAKGNTNSTLGGAAAGLIQALTSAGLSPAMAAQVARMFGGGIPAAGGSNAGGTGGGTYGSDGTDGNLSGTPSVSDTPYDWSGGYQVPGFDSGFGGFDMGIQ
jgi:hypothetical protein